MYASSRHRGLGFVPLVAAAASSPEGQNIIGGAVQWVGGLFSGENPDTPEGWEEKAYAGWLPCPVGHAQRDGSEAMGTIRDHSQWPGSWYKGMEIGPFDVNEVRRALDWAPAGSNGASEFGTRAGLVYALMQPNELRRAPRDNAELANMAVYVAEGRADCGVGWREEPGVAHLVKILHDYRNRPQLGPISLPSATQVSEAGQAVVQKAGTAAGPLLAIGLGLGVAALLKGAL